MTSNGAAPRAPGAVRRVEGHGSSALTGLVELFDDLQMVLRCCERLVTELAGAEGADADPVVVEGVWTVALLSYARCFAPGAAGGALTPEDVATVQPGEEVQEWHQLLLQLREHHADPAVNPRERFSAGVTQDAGGAASGIAITSARQPLVDDLTVRQTGAIAYALSALVDQRIEAQQEAVFEELKLLPGDELEKLELVDVASSD